jgi:lipopolysaccharide assembly protein A
MRIFSYIFLLLIMVFGLTFATLNSNQVAFNYYVGSRQISLSLLLVATFGFGVLLGTLFSLLPYLKVKIANKKLKGRIKIAEKEIENLRSIPLKGE